MSLLPDRAFRYRFQQASTTEEDPDAKDATPHDTAAVLQALGLIDAGTDLDAAFSDFAGDAVAGFYDPTDDELVVRGDKISASLRVTLAHELTHALQDQHFDLVRKDLDKRDDEAAQGFTGLVEGDAVRIQDLFLASLPEDEQKAAEREEASASAGISPDVPEVLLNLIYFPYIFGPQFVTAVVEAGGQARLDQAYADPPSTSEHLMHPEVFLAGQGPREATPPKADRKKVDEGVLGELGLRLLVDSGPDPDAAVEAAKGWGGDRYVAWRNGKRACIRAAIVMDTPSDATELSAALTRLAAVRKGVTVRGTEPILFTSCQ
jgi:hypothetical protein